MNTKDIVLFLQKKYFIILQKSEFDLHNNQRDKYYRSIYYHQSTLNMLSTSFSHKEVRIKLYLKQS